MKSTSVLILSLGLLLSGALFTGCASDQGGSSSGSNSNATAKPDQSKNPEVGMTKDQVLAMYGKTDNITATSSGETWVYNLNMGEAFIPFNFGYRPKLRMVNFDSSGHVASWSYSK